MSDPYEVLGLAPGCGPEEARARYRKLAAAHHPDKHPGATEEERHFHQERFKEISVAYHLLAEEGFGGAGGTGGYAGGAQSTTTPEEWIRRWKRVEKMFEQEDLWGRMGNILRMTLADVASRYAAEVAAESSGSSGGSDEDEEEDAGCHRVRLPVTLEEVATGAVRRVRLFLRGVREPVFADVACSGYPEVRIVPERPVGAGVVRVRLVVKEHPVFQLSPEVDPFDLYATVTVSLFEHFFGAERELTLPGGDTMTVRVPAYFCAAGGGGGGGAAGGAGGSECGGGVLTYLGRGLLGRGSLYVSVTVGLPGNPEEASRALREVCDTVLVTAAVATKRWPAEGAEGARGATDEGLGEMGGAQGVSGAGAVTSAPASTSAPGAAMGAGGSSGASAAGAAGLGRA